MVYIKYRVKLYSDSKTTRVYLGLCIDNNLKWDSQIQKICRNVWYKLSLLNRLRKYMDKELLSKIFLTNIRPCIEYGISVWGHCSVSQEKLPHLVINWA